MPKVAPAKKETTHEKAYKLFNEQAFGVDQGLMSQAKKEENAIKKRLSVGYFQVCNYLPLSLYSGLCDLVNDTGGFGEDCPQGTQAASYDSGNASLASRFTAVDMLEALAHAVRSRTLPIIKDSPRLGVMADETSDYAHRSQLCVMYKVIYKPTMQPVVIYAGVDAIPRGTSTIIWASIEHRCEMDGLDLARVLSHTCFDTCTV